MVSCRRYVTNDFYGLIMFFTNAVDRLVRALAVTVIYCRGEFN